MTPNSLQLSGGVGPFRVNIQDGNGRVNFYWNTTGGTAPVFHAAGEDALRILFGTGGTAPTFFYCAGAGKNAGDPIVWQEIGFTPTAPAFAVSPAATRAHIAAYTNYAVPGYTVGSNRLQIWLDGILCAGGGNAAQHSYLEVGAVGAWSGHIQFHQQIDNTYEITARVR